MLYFALFRSELEYASVALNSVTITDSNLSVYKENLQPFATINFSKLWNNHYDKLLERLNFLTLQNRRRHTDASFLINILNGSKCCPPVVETFRILVPTRNVCYFMMFCCSSSHCSAGTCVYTANAACKSTDAFRNSGLNLNNINWCLFPCCLGVILVFRALILLLFLFVLTL
jgi:hypothetical protein